MYDAPKRKERKLSVLFPRTESSQHGAGINAVALSSGTGQLFTASRDATVKRWDVTGKSPVWSHSYEGHTDWVTGVALLQDVLITCSRDQSCKAWLRDKAPRKCRLQHSNLHDDYITCLAAARHNYMVVTAGLRGELGFWDVHKGLEVSRQPRAGLNEPVQPTLRWQPRKESIYAVAISDDGVLCAAGSTANMLLDWRASVTLGELRGHSDNIRGVLLSQDGRQALTASSDWTVKLWDLGLQRCIQTVAAHTDSVWALAANHDFSVVCSGGRDKCLYRTQIASRTSELLAVEQQPITSLAWDEQRDYIWAGTTAATATSHTEQPGLAFLAPTVPAARSRQAAEAGLQPQQDQPSAATAGIPPLVCSAALTDRRYVLAQDAVGRVELWDILKGTLERDFGIVEDFKQKERDLFKPASVLSWFSYDTKLGSLEIHLEPQTAFQAEAYARELCMPDCLPEQKLNFGVMVLRGLFKEWLSAYQDRLRLAEAAGAAEAGSNAPPRASSSALAKASPHGVPRVFDFLHNPHPPVVMCRMKAPSPAHSWDGEPWRVLATEFSGREEEDIQIPLWVADVVQHGTLPAQTEQTKYSFTLRPAEDSNLPALLQSRLNAPRIMEVSKVADYCKQKLADHDVHLTPVPLYWSTRQQGHQAVYFDFTLSAVKKYIWRRSDDVVFNYRLYKPHRRAPPPLIKPPV
eukprot:jgi/Astpho2/5199/Aster-x1280